MSDTISEYQREFQDCCNELISSPSANTKADVAAAKKEYLGGLFPEGIDQKELYSF